MILVDTSVWIDHLRRADQTLQTLLHDEQVLSHPCIRLELALGSIPNRPQTLKDIALLPQAQVATSEELFTLVDRKKLYRRGIGLTDLHLICCALFDNSVSIWTRDRRLGEIADELGLRASLP